jgi:putative salt-induced outer membrane protein
MRTKGRILRAVWLACTLTLAFAPAVVAKEGSPWKARTEFSYVQTGGNSDTKTLAGLGEVSLDQTPNRYFLAAGGLFSEDDGTTTASRWRVAGRYERALTERLYAFLEANYLKDTFAGFDSKIAVGPGLGYDILKTDAHLLKGGVAVLQTWDNTTDDDTDSYLTGKAFVDYAWQILENLRFRQYFDYLTSFADSDQYYFNSESKLEVQVSTNVSLATGYVVNYQNAPPGDSDETDTRFFTSLIIDY